MEAKYYSQTFKKHRFITVLSLFPQVVDTSEAAVKAYSNASNSTALLKSSTGRNFSQNNLLKRGIFSLKAEFFSIQMQMQTVLKETDEQLSEKSSVSFPLS